MELILFAKHLSGLAIDDLVKNARASGVDGFDFPIRDGYAVNPDNFETALPQLVKDYLKVIAVKSMVKTKKTENGRIRFEQHKARARMSVRPSGENPDFLVV